MYQCYKRGNVLKEDKMTVAQVVDVIDSEGLGYAIRDYMSGDFIEDQELAKLWDEARKSIMLIETHIKRVMIKEDPNWEW